MPLLRYTVAMTAAFAFLPVLGADESKPVSFYNDIRPIFQAHCQGCHQPARARGEYVMTEFAKLFAGGSSEKKAIVAGAPDKSYLLEMITPGKDGKAQMPEGKPALAADQVALVKRWIQEGAKDDTPAGAKDRIDMEHPPLYSRPPVITSLDYSPDGKLLAIAGFHEIVLVEAATGKVESRLVGLSQRIQSLRFSPDGKLLAAVGGQPARMGEIQIWSVAKKKLVLSQPVSFDTLYGVSWSPDGTKIAFGCADNSARAIDATTGEQVLFQGAHTDWVLDTIFSKDGSHLVSVSRDMTVKLTEVATQRLVDNVTSITPFALKGGIETVTRHPERDEIVIGGADGQAKVYRIFRVTNRVIGDDANLIRKMPAMMGRIYGVAVSNDGKRIAACSSLDGLGEVDVYGYEFSTDLPETIKRINTKVVTQRTAEEKQTLDKYHSEGVKRIFRTELKTGIYAVTFQPDGKLVAAAGADGKIRYLDPVSGKVVKEYVPAPFQPAKSEIAKASARAPQGFQPSGVKVVADKAPAKIAEAKLSVEPKEIELNDPFATVQLIVTATLPTGESIDVTRSVERVLKEPILEVSPAGLVRGVKDGKTTLRLIVPGGKAVNVPVTVAGLGKAFHVDYVRDVMPVLSRLGCNQGTCHGSAKGKNGFRLSLRGYDPIHDVRSLTDDLAARRVALASPDDSLMLLKATGAVPHVGGQLIQPGEPYYEVLRRWIAAGATVNMSAPRVAKIDVFPIDPIVQKAGDKQQLRVVATYTDGKKRDVTQDAFLESGNIEVAQADRGGLMTALRRGLASVLVRFEGQYAATSLFVMGDREGFVWKTPPSYGKIDDLVAAKWQQMKIEPSGLCTDADFIRRVHLDLTGLPPTAEEVKTFLADKTDSKAKREALIDKLVGNKDYVEYWTNKWADLLQVNRKFLGVEGASAFRKWIHDEIDKNTPYDQFARKILTAAGSNKDNPAASYFKILRKPAETMENTTHLFMAVRFNCNKCHDHPFERWTQDQYYETAAYFAQYDLQPDPASGGKTVGGTAVEKAVPLFEKVVDLTQGDILHERTNLPTPPKFPFDCNFEKPTKGDRRDQLAAWITSKDNQYFARSYVNRVWGYLLGVGIIDPLDDIRAGNPPSNPELLDYLTRSFIESGFDVRQLMKLITKSRTYQLSVASNKWNEDDKIFFSHTYARRLPAEVLFDAVHRVTGSTTKIPGVAPGTRAAELPDSGIELPGGFLATLGRPARESSCECERVTGMQLGSVMALISGPTVAEAIADPKNALAKLVAEVKDDNQLVDELFLRVLNRHATPGEVKASLDAFRGLEEDHEKLQLILKDREAFWEKESKRLEQIRNSAIAKAKADLAAREKEIEPKVKADEAERLKKVDQAKAMLAKVEAKLDASQVGWEKKQDLSVAWTPIDFTTLNSNKSAMLKKQPDLSILASGPNDKQVYTLVGELTGKGITAFRLEALTHEKLPGGGPGRAPGGNFVLNEFTVEIAPKKDPKQVQKVEFTKATADYAQDKFASAQLIDTVTANTNGWAVGGSTGNGHWVTFETKTPIGFEGGTIVTITMPQNFQQKDFTLGRFRISTASAKAPVGLSISDELADILKVGAGERTDAQKATLSKYFRSTDRGLLARQKELADAQKPLPVDPKVTELKASLQAAMAPVGLDPLLAQLRRDVQMSSRLLGDRRLTGAQDIVWALVNSPAFLFNR